MKQFYRQGEKIYEAGSNRYIDYPEWQKDWSGKSTEVSAPGSNTKTNQKDIENQENILGRPLTSNELSKMYPDYASQYGQGGFDRATGLYNQRQDAYQNFEGMTKSPNGQAGPRTGMNILQEALKIKNNTKNQGFGESEIFKLAGVGGIGALSQSLSARGQEIEYDYAQFQNIVGGVASLYQDQITSAINKYKMASEMYKEESDRLSKLDENLRSHKQQIELLQLKSDIDNQITAEQLWKTGDYSSYEQNIYNHWWYEN
jgi:hypothetical protein